MRLYTIKNYECELCGHVYDNEKDCLECEKGHAKPVSIVEAERYSYVQNDRPYPWGLYVVMDDGVIVRYTYSSKTDLKVSDSKTITDHIISRKDIEYVSEHDTVEEEQDNGVSW